MKRLFEWTREQCPALLRHASTIDKGHGRLETRSISVLATHGTGFVVDGINQVAHLKRTREILKYKKETNDEVFLITNMGYDELDAQRFLELKRSYWAVENKLHYRKDMVFGEDRSTIRAEHGPHNMATLRNFALGLLLANGIGNVKRCVDNLQHDPSLLLKKAA